MTRFLANCEIDSHVSLTTESDFLKYDHPHGRYQVFVRNLRVEEGSDPPLLSVQMIFEAESLASAKEVVTNLLREFSDYVAFANSAKCRARRVLQIFNWEPEAQGGMREAMYYEGFKNHDLPIPAMSRKIVETVALLHTVDASPRLRRAIRWFSDGLAAPYQDDQFINFWLAIEVLAQLLKDPALVPDHCSKCRSPLYCQACKASNLHKPYPKQAIGQLFEKYVNGDWDVFFSNAERSRNMLMHGEEVETIEGDLNISFPPLVNAMGRLARVAILNQFLPAIDGKKIHLLETNRFVHMSLTVGAYVAFGFAANFDNPDPSHFPKLEISRTLIPE